MQLSSIAKRLWFLPVLCLVVWAAAACSMPEPEEPDDFASPPATGVFESPLAPSATVPPLVLEAGSGGAKGVLVAYPPSWEGSTLTAYFAPFYPDEQEDRGIFVLEPSVHPGVEVGPGGVFQLGTIPPGQYVIVIGPGPENALPIQEAGQPQVFEVLGGEILEIGEIDLQ